MSVPEPPASVTLRLLGAPSLNAGGRSLPFAPERPFLLLAVLACRRDWVRRDELADLLYPGRDLETARSNLRKVIFLARKVGGVGEIEQRGDLLRWAPDSDLQRFEAACDAKRHGDAVAAYGGPLLLGLDGAWPAGAADWLDAERQRLQARWHEACTRRLEALAGDPEAARALAQQMLRHDPLDDTALQALGRADQSLGRADEALAAVADFTRRLSSELQMEPSAAVRRMERDLRQATPAMPPPAGAPIVGRRQELAQARARLADPACRVLSLLGPPGVGKSALARTLAAELGAAWVVLEDLSQTDGVPHRVAPALGLTLDGALPPWDALGRALGERASLVALDSCEHLLLAAPLERLLAEAPGLRLLASSRTPLGVAGEWRLPLEGLPLPDADERDPEVLRANDAVRLFEQRALPLAPAFDLGAEAAEVVALLHEIDGLPLAVELLAAWRRLMPVREVRAELAASLDVLEPTQPGERSVRASFARSWQQLGAVEQRVLAQLALLPGPCSRELLRTVLQAPLPVLAALVDRSLLRAGDDGRFVLHPLIRRCAEPLATDREAVLERHARHVARSLAPSQAELGADLPHAQAAWHWGVEHRDVPVLGALLTPYLGHLQARARWRDGLAEQRAAVAALADGGGDGTVRAPAEIVARVLCAQAQSHYALGELDACRASALQALALAERWSLPEPAASAHARLGAVAWQRGDYASARESFLSCQRCHRENGDDAAARGALGWLALVDKALGDYDRALSRYRELLDDVRARDALVRNLYLLNNMGNLLRLLGRGTEGLAVLREGLALARAHERPDDESFLLTNIALAQETLGHLDAAAADAGRAVEAGVENGEPMIEAAARLARARIAAARGADPAAAWADVRAALAIGRRLQSPPLRVQCLSSAGLVMAHAGERSRGIGIVGWAMAQSSFARSEREDAQRHLERLAPEALAGAEPADRIAPETPIDEVLMRLPAAARP